MTRECCCSDGATMWKTAKELINLVKEKGFEYVKQYFQYSILENYNAKIDDHVVLKRETWWKETLQSRTFGYNGN